MNNSDPKSLAGRPKEKARQLGQVITPFTIASQMVKRLLRDCRNERIKILDPCVGPSTFPRIIASNNLQVKNINLIVIDIDNDMINFSKKMITVQNIRLDSMTADYLELPMDNEHDYAILNPPYIRQEWIDKKLQYQEFFRGRYGVSVPGTSNLYVYFLVKVIIDLKPNGQFACIVYDSWQSTHYGRWLLDFMKSHCKSLQIETVPNQPFSSRLIDATVIYGTKKDEFYQDGLNTSVWSSTSNPGFLSDIQGFSLLQDLFTTRRGLRLKQVDFFLCDFADCGKFDATPFLKKIGRLKGYCVPDDHPEAALLITLQRESPVTLAELNRRLELAKLKPDENVSILTWFVERPDIWFLHGEALLAPLVFNYYLRNRPRHIFNPKRVYADNFYGLQPLGAFSPLAWLAVLNSTAVATEILAHSRNQGSGLAKIQLFEYRKVHIPDLKHCSKVELDAFHKLGLNLVEQSHLAAITIRYIDELISAVFADPRLKEARINEIYREVDVKARNPKEEEVCLG